MGMVDIRKKMVKNPSENWETHPHSNNINKGRKMKVKKIKKNGDDNFCANWGINILLKPLAGIHNIIKRTTFEHKMNRNISGQFNLFPI